MYQQDLPRARAIVEMREYLDDSLHIFYQEKELKFKEIRNRFNLNSETPSNTINERKNEYYKEILVLQDNGLKISEISEYLKLSENTVRNYLNRKEPLNVKRKRTSKLFPYDKLIRRWIKEEKLIARDIHKRLIGIGFKGSRRNTEFYVRKLREEDLTSIVI